MPPPAATPSEPSTPPSPARPSEALPAPSTPTAQGSDWTFARRVLIAFAVGALAYAAWKLAYVLLLLFAAIVLAVILRALAALVVRLTGLSRRWAITLTTVTVVTVLVAFFYLFGRQIGVQLMQVFERLPSALGAFAERTGIEVSMEALRRTMRQFATTSGLPGALGYGSSAIGALADLLVIVIGGIYLATDATTYQRGAAMLFPLSQRARVERAASDAGQALTQWFFGQLIAMLAVGLASWVLFAWIGLPSAATLALIAGLSNFVPMIGPILGGVPALIVSSTLGLEPFWWTLAAIVAVQQVESYLLTPAIQKRAIDLPPAVGIFAIVIFGSLFGVLGVVLAVPLAVVAFVAVQRLWLNEVLGERVDVIGQEKA